MHYDRLRELAARAIAHCPRDLAEALAKECGVPMPEGYCEPSSALAAWAKEGDLREEILEAWERTALPESWIKRDGT